MEIKSNKLIALLLVFSMIFSLTIISHAEFSPGDVNNDNTINSSDALIVLQYSVGSIDNIDVDIADINKDGVINSVDALQILRISVGEITDDIFSEPIIEFVSEETDAFQSDFSENFKSKVAQIADAIGISLNIVFDPDTQSYTIRNKDGIDTGLLGYKYSTKDKIFYTAENSWQRNFGFNELYDKAAAICVMSYNTMRVKFNYQDKDWMIQFWKGQYGFAFIGAEIGVYNRPAGSTNGTHYECANDEQKLYITMDVYRQNPDNHEVYKKLFTRSRTETWWCTGFVLGNLGIGQYNISDSGTSKLKVDTKIEFKDAEMAEAFIHGLNNVKTIENNALLRGSTRAIGFTACESEEEYDSCQEDCKYVLCEDGLSVRVTYR